MSHPLTSLALGRPKARSRSLSCHLRLVFLLAAAASSGSAAAATSFGSLVFREPEGVVLPGDAIPVWLRFELQADQPAVIGSGSDASQLDPRYLPDDLQAFSATRQLIKSFGRNDPGVSFEATGVGVSATFVCLSSFVDPNVCTGSGSFPYEFDFDFGPSSIFAIFQGSGSSLQPAQPVDFLFGTFAPAGGNAPLGLYHFYGAGIGLTVSGTATVPAFERRVAGEIVKDEFGNPVPLFERDANGDLVLDENGDPIPLFEFDEFNNRVPVFERYTGEELVLDESGNPIPLFERDPNGEPVLDEFGNPVRLSMILSNVRGSTLLGTTPCFNGPFDPSCAGNFSREVVPLPAAGWLFVSALGGALVAARRRTRVATT